jgi:cell division protease FtsH
MRILFKNLLTGILTLTLIVIIFGTIFARTQENTRDVGLNELVNEIQEGNVEEVSVESNRVVATLRDEDTRLITQKESGGTFVDTLRSFGVSEETLQGLQIDVNNNEGTSLLITILLNILFPVILIGGLLWLSVRQAQKGNVQAMTFGKSLARMILPSKDKKKRLTFDDVAGLKEAKEELYEVVEFLKNPQKFSEIGAKVPKGVLLIGPPGTGKTLLARAVASEAEVPFFYTSGSEFVEMFVGVGASRIRDLFKTAVKNSPALIFIDELDAVGRSRGSGVGGGNDEREQTLNQILVEMDGFEPNKGLIVLAATNRPDVLDSALLRPGRFDRRVNLTLPDISERQQILKIHAENKPLEKDVRLRKIAERTPGFSGADLENLLNEAAIYAARQNKKTVSELDILSSIDKVLMGPERKSKVISPRDKEITAYHEAGHAVIGHFSEHSDPIQKVTIIPRGRAGGYTLKIPTEDKSYHRREEFFADIAVALGGYLAEKLKFGDITTGSSNDLQKATQMAEGIVKRYGMSEEFGPINLDFDYGRQTYEQHQYSEDTLRKIDNAIQRIMKESYEKGEQILRENRDKWETLAQELMVIETVERDEFEAIMNGTYVRNTAKEPSETKDDKKESVPQKKDEKKKPSDQTSQKTTEKSSKEESVEKKSEDTSTEKKK